MNAQRLICVLLSIALCCNLLTGCLVCFGPDYRDYRLGDDSALDEAPDMVYKLAPMYKTQRNGCTELWFVLEFETAGWQLYSDSPFFIVDKTRNTKLQTFEVYDGVICETNHRTNTDEINDKHIYTVKVESTYDIDFDDIQVSGYCYYKQPGSNVGGLVTPEVVFLDFNAIMFDITTQQDFIHMNTLFELNGKYYIFTDVVLNKTFVVSSLSGCSYEILGVNGTVDDLAAEQALFVYGPAAKQYAPFGYTTDRKLQPVVIPDGYGFHYVPSDAGNQRISVSVGYQFLSGYISDNTVGSKLIKSSLLAYRISGNDKMILYHTD